MNIYRYDLHVRGPLGRPPWPSTGWIREASQIESSLGPEDGSVAISQMEDVDADLFSQHRHKVHGGVYSTYADGLLH